MDQTDRQVAALLLRESNAEKVCEKLLRGSVGKMAERLLEGYFEVLC